MVFSLTSYRSFLFLFFAVSAAFYACFGKSKGYISTHHQKSSSHHRKQKVALLPSPPKHHVSHSMTPIELDATTTTKKKKKAPKLVCASPPATRKACAITNAFANHGRWVEGEKNDPLLSTNAERRGFVWPNETFNERSGRILNWKWKAACPICEFEAIDRPRLCRILSPYRRVFFVGDSVQGQFSSTLTSYAGGPKKDYETVTILNSKRKPWPHDFEWNVCRRENNGKPTRITYMRDDFLWSTHNESHGGTITMKTKTNNDRVTNVNWLDMPEIYNASEDVIIMSAGPHYHNANEFARNAEQLATKLALHLKTIATGNINPIVYRYAVEGHPKCDPYKVPFTQEEHDKMWENVKANPGAKAVFMDKYSWHLQSYYNGQQYEALKRHDVPALIFDVETASRLRPDAHNRGDCLHLKMPGLMDQWSIWLLNYLEAFSGSRPGPAGY